MRFCLLVLVPTVATGVAELLQKPEWLAETASLQIRCPSQRSVGDTCEEVRQTFLMPLSVSSSRECAALGNQTCYLQIPKTASTTL